MEVAKSAREHASNARRTMIAAELLAEGGGPGARSFSGVPRDAVATRAPAKARAALASALSELNSAISLCPHEPRYYAARAEVYTQLLDLKSAVSNLR